MMIRSFIAAAAIAATAAPSMAQVTSVSQLRDVQPTEWSYQAISNLVSRYGCVAGYPNGTFQPGQPATRAELAALTNACLDNITEFYTSADAALASALRAEFSKELAVTNTRVTALETATSAKAQGVGNYLGLGVLLNQQGIPGDGNSAGDVISGATLQGRYAVRTFSNQNAISVRPYINAVAGPNGQIGAGGGATLSYDWSIARKALPNGSKVSAANVYAGAGYQVPFTNNVQANFQSAVGREDGQAVFVLGLEGRITNSLVGFADLKFPTRNSGVNDAYAPVFTTGLGFKF